MGCGGREWEKRGKGKLQSVHKVNHFSIILFTNRAHCVHQIGVWTIVVPPPPEFRSYCSSLPRTKSHIQTLRCITMFCNGKGLDMPNSMPFIGMDILDILVFLKVLEPTPKESVNYIFVNCHWDLAQDFCNIHTQSSREVVWRHNEWKRTHKMDDQCVSYRHLLFGKSLKRISCKLGSQTETWVFYPQRISNSKRPMCWQIYWLVLNFYLTQIRGTWKEGTLIQKLSPSD